MMNYLVAVEMESHTNTSLKTYLPYFESVQFVSYWHRSEEQIRNDSREHESHSLEILNLICQALRYLKSRMLVGSILRQNAPQNLLTRFIEPLVRIYSLSVRSRSAIILFTFLLLHRTSRIASWFHTGTVLVLIHLKVRLKCQWFRNFLKNCLSNSFSHTAFWFHCPWLEDLRLSKVGIKIHPFESLEFSFNSKVAYG